MIRRFEYRGSSPVLVEYLHAVPDPLPATPINGITLKVADFKSGPGNTYTRHDISIRYDGVYWWCFYFCAEFKVETIEELEKLMT